jgi:hypothetical protein
MDEKTMMKYLQNNKLRKLANYAVRGDKLDKLDSGEKALVAFYSVETITSAWSKELADMQNLISEDLNKRLNMPDYVFEQGIAATKDLILLYKIENHFAALRLLKPTIDRYWTQLDESMESIREKYKNDTTYIIGYRVTAKLLLSNTNAVQEELQAAIRSKFPWPQEQHGEAKQIAGDTATRNMQRYINQLSDALNGESNGTSV